MKFYILPLVPDNGGHSIPDEILAAVWQRIVQEDKIKHLFYGGMVKDIEGWLRFIKSPRNHVVLVIDLETRHPIHIAWLNDIGPDFAWAHHCSIGKYRKGAWEEVRNYWKGFPSIEILFGLTPESNQRAVKFLEKICGFTILGKVPRRCLMAYEDRKRVAGIISYFDLRGDEQWAAAVKVEAEAGVFL